MTRLLSRAMSLSVCIAAAVLLGGCGENPAGGGASSPAGPGSPAPQGIKLIMMKVAKGPNSLTNSLNTSLKAEQPAWETIVPQTKELATLAADLGRYDPPRGTKDSWARLTTAYAEDASALAKAAEAKDKDAALAAHGKLAGACMSCHREHRVIPGMGGPPNYGRPGGFAGGPPPGGPGPQPAGGAAARPPGGAPPAGPPPG